LLGLGKVNWWIFYKISESCLVIGFGISVVSTYPSFVKQFHNGIIQKMHAVFSPGLNYRWNLVGFTFADKISCRWSCNLYLKGGAEPICIGSF